MDLQNQGRIYLVTGASGYVGGRLIRDLLNDQKRVRVFVRDAKKITHQSWSNVVEIVEGNANNKADWEKEKVDVHKFREFSREVLKDFHFLWCPWPELNRRPTA